MKDSELQKLIWQQMLESASKLVSQVNDIGMWATEFLGVELYSNEVEIVKAVIDLNQGYNVIIGSRGEGKTYSVCIGVIKLCLENAGLEVGVFGPRADQATRIITETKKILSNSKIKDRVDWDHTTAERLVFKNQSSMLALSAAETSLQEGFHFSIIICVKGTTKILTDNGLIPIKDIVEKKLFVKVLSKNINNGELEWKEIEEYRKNKRENRNLLKIEYSRGKRTKYLICTEDHKLLTKNRGFVCAKDLTTEDILDLAQISGNLHLASTYKPYLVRTAEMVKTRKQKRSYISWNKGLTKETSSGVARASVNASIALKKKWANGELSAYQKGLTKETHSGLKSTSEKLKM